SLVFALAPALRTSRVDLADALKDGSPGASGGRQRVGDALVVAELAMAVVLLIGAGLMLRTLWSLQQVPLGFEPSHVLTMRLSLPAATYQRPEQVVGLFAGLVDRIRQLPGVEAAGAARSLPLGSTIGDFGLVVEGYTPPPGTNAKGDWQIVTHGYLAAIAERVVRGRAFNAADTTDAMLVARSTGMCHSRTCGRWTKWSERRCRRHGSQGSCSPALRHWRSRSPQSGCMACCRMP